MAPRILPYMEIEAESKAEVVRVGAPLGYCLRRPDRGEHDQGQRATASTSQQSLTRDSDPRRVHSLLLRNTLSDGLDSEF